MRRRYWCITTRPTSRYCSSSDSPRAIEPTSCRPVASRSSAATRYPTHTARSKIRTSTTLVPSGHRAQQNYGPVLITWRPVKRSSTQLRTRCATGQTTLTHRTIYTRMYVVRLLRVADKVEFYYVNSTQRCKNSYTDDRGGSYKHAEALPLGRRLRHRRDLQRARSRSGVSSLPARALRGMRFPYRSHPNGRARPRSRLARRSGGLYARVRSCRVLYRHERFERDELLAALFIKHPKRLEGATVAATEHDGRYGRRVRRRRESGRA